MKKLTKKCLYADIIVLIYKQSSKKQNRLPDLDLKQPIEACLPPEMKTWHGWWRS